MNTNSASPGSVRLTQALPGEAQIIENLMQLYTHDFSEFSWEVAVARKNVPAQEFWRDTIQNAGKASHIRELDLCRAEWNGPIFRFEWR